MNSGKQLRARWLFLLGALCPHTTASLHHPSSLWRPPSRISAGPGLSPPALQPQKNLEAVLTTCLGGRCDGYCCRGCSSPREGSAGKTGSRPCAAGTGLIKIIARLLKLSNTRSKRGVRGLLLSGAGKAAVSTRKQQGGNAGSKATFRDAQVPSGSGKGSPQHAVSEAVGPSRAGRAGKCPLLGNKNAYGKTHFTVPGTP